MTMATWYKAMYWSGYSTITAFEVIEETPSMLVFVNEFGKKRRVAKESRETKWFPSYEQAASWLRECADERVKRLEDALNEMREVCSNIYDKFPPTSN